MLSGHTNRDKVVITVTRKSLGVEAVIEMPGTLTRLKFKSIHKSQPGKTLRGESSTAQ